MLGNPAKLRLRRGYILLMAGGALIAISLSVLAYYGLKLVTGIQAQTTEVLPGHHLIVSQNINGSQGQAAYLVAVNGPVDAFPTMTIKDPANRTVLSTPIEPPVAFRTFSTAGSGNYTLDLLNPSNSSAIQVAASLGDQQEVITKRLDLSAAVAAVVFGFLIVAGIGVTIAGGVLTIFDKRRISKMKQYGDTSDLV
jgi:hypothetical protein